jgi:putative (di)nucleoside polyphosphate hydrolase|tara:strand:+ start:324 stop:797 length:474 start_codon:yes stop_codon:yes gene_type:complete
MKNYNILPLRIGVGIVLLNDKNKVLVGKRIDNPKNFWQLPQGGVDDNENYLNAAKRELEEETSIKSVELIKELDGWLKYDLPENLIGKIWNGKYGGQKQKWFIMKFLGNDNEININTEHPEFLEWKWIELDKITDFVVDFKLNIYKEIKEKVKKIIS